MGYKIARAARRSDFSQLFLFSPVYTELVSQQTYVNMYEAIPASEKVWQGGLMVLVSSRGVPVGNSHGDCFAQKL